MVADFELHRARGELFVVARAGELHGYIVLLDQKKCLFVENMAVDPGSRRQGLAGRLLAFAHDIAASRGKAQLRLYTNAVMQDAISLYRHAGWREIERRFEDGFDRLYFEIETGPASESAS